MADGAVEKIKRIGKGLEQAKKLHKPVERDAFEALIQQKRIDQEATKTALPEPLRKTESLMEAVKNLNQRVEYISRESAEELSLQVEDVVGQIDLLKHKLQAPGVEVSSSTRTILQNKLSHIDESLKIALSNAGVEYAPPEKTSKLAAPIDRFLGLLTHGQSQLEKLGATIQSTVADGKELSPAKMLLIQVKVNTIQQEIELFTSMLNKALESIKTVMNVQV